GSGGSVVTTRNAADVPTLRATREGSMQSEPTLPAAPSPTAGSQSTPRSAGHRIAHGARRPRRASVQSRSGKRRASSISAAASASGSQRAVAWSRSPVACEHAVEARGDGLVQPGRVVLDAAVRRDGGLVRDLAHAPRDWMARGVVEARARGGGPDVERDDHWG